MHGIILSSPYNTVQKHNLRTKQVNDKFNKAMHKFAGVLDKLVCVIIVLGSVISLLTVIIPDTTKKAFNNFLNMRHVYMTAVKGDIVHPLLV